MINNVPITIKSSLQEKILSNWERCQIILFSAPCGCGKTTTATALLCKNNICVFDASEEHFYSQNISEKCDVILVDELQYLLDVERQEELCSLINNRPDLHFVLLSRGRTPGWLMPFQFAGKMLTIETPELLFDPATSLKMIELRGCIVTPNELSKIQHDIKGYPLAMKSLCDKLKDGSKYSKDMLDSIKREVFVYFEQAVFRRFEEPLRKLLISLAPFDSFCLELAKMVSGEPQVGNLMRIIQYNSQMILFDGLNSYSFRPIFREFLLWELNQILTEQQQQSLYSRAALYYELNNEPGYALHFYSKAKESKKISELLVKNAQKHPGIGHYREMEQYYFSLPREEILRSTSLMSAMSMLNAMHLNYNASEQWYSELQNYAAQLKKTDFEYKNARGKLAYLDIALPQRGSKGLIDVIKTVFYSLNDKHLSIQSFSVTSNLPSIMNGGKDFCEWSKKDDLLYATMRKAIETILGCEGVGLADCAICESKFEKGEDISKRLLTLMSRLGEIQAKGTPDIEFAVVGLLARVQISQGKAKVAKEAIENLRIKFLCSGHTRFLPNIDAMICRINLRMGDIENARVWLKEKAPKNDTQLWAMWRYQYFTRAIVQIIEGEYDDALLLLAKLKPYCEYCSRVMDCICLRLLMSLCYYRQNDENWKNEFCIGIDTCYEYKFIMPVAQYGVAILPLLLECGWDKDLEYLDRLISATRTQAIYYPRLLKQQSQLVEALSTTEMQVLRLLCENLSNQEIGYILNIKLSTVKTHVSHILQKLDLSRRSEIKEVAQKLRLI